MKFKFTKKQLEIIGVVGVIATIIGVIIAAIALSMQFQQSNTQRVQTPDTPIKSDFIVKDVSNLDLHGDSFNWQSNFTITLDIESSNPSKIWVGTSNQSFVLGGNSYMLYGDFPKTVSIMNATELHSPAGINEVKLSIPIHAQFLIKGNYQAYESQVAIGQLNFIISIQDLKTQEVTTIPSSTNVNWIK